MGYHKWVDILEERVILLSLLHNGLLTVHCGDCTPEIQEEMNCSLEDREEPVIFEHNLMKELFACPIKMIPQEIFELYDKYAFIQEFGGASMRYEECDALYWWFHKTYLHYHNIHSIRKMEIDRQKAGLK